MSGPDREYWHASLDDFVAPLMPTDGTTSRREFMRLSLTASGGLLFAASIAPRLLGAATADATPVDTESESAIGLFIQIDPDGMTHIGARCPEIGQGVYTALPMIIAEELDADWSKVRAVQLPLGIKKIPEAPGVSWKYGPQGAGGSTSVPEAWSDLRQIGARARHLLVTAAARQWQTDASALRTEAGEVIRADGRRLSYAELAPAAAQMEWPVTDVPLKSAKDYRLLGSRQRQLGLEDIVTGRAGYGIDARMPGAWVAVVARCPHFDGELMSFDASAALKIPGVRQVLALPGPKFGEPISANLAPGVAVLADDTWSALKGREALKIEWKPGPWGSESTAALDQQCGELLKGKGIRCREDGDFDGARQSAAKVIEAVYRVPYVSHCPLEPQNACVHVESDRVRIIAPMQMPSGASRLAQQITGVDRFDIDVQMTRVGGGFGRRLSNDFVAEALILSKLSGKPIRLLWTREDDLRHDFYRPFGHHHLIATLDDQHRLSGWAHRLASASKYYRRPDMPDDQLWTSELYPDDFPAQLLPNLRLEWFAVKSGMTRGSWRAPAHTANAFAVQSFIDEVADATGQDPLAFRLKLLGPPRQLAYSGHGGPVFETGRLSEVLRRAAQRVGWGRRLQPGRGIGLAAHFTFGGYAAHAMEVSVATDGSYRIERCVCVVDVGRPINRLGIEAQMMGGTIDGISTARNLEIHIDKGQVVEGNFDSYPLLRMTDAPDVEVEIIDSEREPSGAGEMGIPTAAPALTNALFAASGKRIRSLPIARQMADAG